MCAEPALNRVGDEPSAAGATWQVVFTPGGVRGRVPAGVTVLDAARLLGADLGSVCGGRGLCGRCQFQPLHGTFHKHGLVSAATSLSPQDAVELAYGARRGLESGRRLGCQARMEGDLVVDVPPESRRHRHVICKRLATGRLEVDPVIAAHCVDVPSAVPDRARSDIERLLAALARERCDAGGYALDPGVARSLPGALRAGDNRVTVIVRGGNEIIAVRPGFSARIAGIAIDVGSTTLAAYLFDLESGAELAAHGVMNPQIAFGEDVMSRVSYAMQHPDRAPEMTRVVRAAIGDLAHEVARAAGIDAAEICEVVLVGNPVMHHLLLGLDPVGLGQAPFAPVEARAITVRARDLGLDIAPGARSYVLPLIAGHVGADTAAVILAEAPHRGDALTLIADIGTNAEIVLGNCDRLLAASSPTGPAFEGAQISCGSRATVGAIERVRIDPRTLEPRFKVIGIDLWSDAPGFRAAQRAVPITGICGSGVVEALVELRRAGVLTGDGRIDGDRFPGHPRIAREGRTFAYHLYDGARPLRLTQHDVRAIQLAKAALAAGAMLLLERFGAREPGRVRLAGGFGSRIDPGYAVALGLLPVADARRVSTAGNAAGAGACVALVNAGARAEIEALVRRIERIETATDPRFQELFVAAMAIPDPADFPRAETST